MVERFKGKGGWVKGRGESGMWNGDSEKEKEGNGMGNEETG
jgi:hypothetical protein